MAADKELGHKVKQVGLWKICEVCKMTKRKSGWWKPCPGAGEPKLYPVDCEDDSWRKPRATP